MVVDVSYLYLCIGVGSSDKEGPVLSIDRITMYYHASLIIMSYCIVSSNSYIMSI